MANLSEEPTRVQRSAAGVYPQVMTKIVAASRMTGNATTAIFMELFQFAAWAGSQKRIGLRFPGLSVDVAVNK